VGRTAYLWGWPLVNAANRGIAFCREPPRPAAAARSSSPPGADRRRRERTIRSPAGNGWNSPVNNARWGTDYLNRTATAKSNMYDNKPEETKYIYRDNDSKGKQLNGQNSYAITFAKGQVPPVRGFWSLTLYNDLHLFNPNPLKRYSLGTKNKNLKYRLKRVL
jgi:hypothetical protein